MLELRHVTKIYNGRAVLEAISFSVARGETVCLLGPSGSGKSTTLRIIAGLEQPDAGDILWAGKSLLGVPPHERRFGLMFQDYALFPHMTVWDNVAFGLRMQGLSRAEVERRVREALARVNLLDFARRRVTDLSGGEQQRVALARTLAPRPRLLMLDEPLGSLDRALRERLLEDLRHILAEEDIPAIYVTHDQEEAFAIADRIILLYEGRIVQEGTPEAIYERPATPWVARFFGLTNLLPGRVVGLSPLKVDTEEGLFLPECDATDIEVGDEVVLLLRPRGARLVSEKEQGANMLQGRVTDAIFQGDVYRLEVKTRAGHTFKFITDHAISRGETVTLRIEQDKIQCWREKGLGRKNESGSF